MGVLQGGFVLMKNRRLFSFVIAEGVLCAHCEAYCPYSTDDNTDEKITEGEGEYCSDYNTENNTEKYMHDNSLSLSIEFEYV